MKKPSPGKTVRQAHTANTKFGSGDYYGTGIKQKVGRMREDYLNPAISSKDLGKPPKSLA